MFAKHYGKLTIMIAFGLLILALSCGDDPLEPIIIELGGTMVVAHVPSSDAITIDGVPDATWDRAKKFQIVAKSATGDPAVINMKAITDSTYFYLLVSWEDPTKDVRPDNWEWIQEPNQPKPTPFRSGGQDFFFAIFDDGGNGNVGADCHQMCHSIQIDTITTVDSMRNDGAALVDTWLWKSGESDPVTRLLDMSFPAGSASEPDVSVQETEVVIGNEDGGEPHWMHKDTLAFTEDFLYISDTLEWRADFWPDSETVIGWPAGAMLPGYVLNDAIDLNEDESQWEVVAKGEYDNLANRWTLEVKRKMNTGHIDDLPFVLGQRVSCTAGVRNSPVGNSPYPHYGTEPFDIQF
ncbi:MAG: ethylbenzene dehydrogenase-related protein [Candidatus Zixiibacteriota bacterium]